MLTPRKLEQTYLAGLFALLLTLETLWLLFIPGAGTWFTWSLLGLTAFGVVGHTALVVKFEWTAAGRAREAADDDQQLCRRRQSVPGGVR